MIKFIKLLRGVNLMNYCIEEKNPRGFFSVLICALTSIQKMVSENHGFILGTNFRLYGGRWDVFFEPINRLHKSELMKIFSSENSCDYTANTAKTKEFAIQLHQLKNEYIIPTNRLHEYVKIKNQYLPANYMAVHKRGTDHGMHSPLLDINIYFNKIDAVIDLYDAVYLATDEYHTVSMFKSRYGQKLIVQADVIRSDSSQPIHFLSPGIEIGLQTYTDCMAMAGSSFLIATGSNVATYAKISNPELNIEYLN